MIVTTLAPLPALVLAVALLATYIATRAACDAVAARLRAARHRRLTRRHGAMLRRALAQAGTEGWR